MGQPIRLVAAIAIAVNGSIAAAQETAQDAAKSIRLSPGSTAFCLYELPASDDKRRWVNLGIVQYLEYSRGEIRLYYGGGNLGSGHEVRIPVATPAQLEETLDRIRQAAASCR